MPDTSMPTRAERKHVDNCGRSGNPRVVVPNCKMDCACWCHKAEVAMPTRGECERKVK